MLAVFLGCAARDAQLTASIPTQNMPQINARIVQTDMIGPKSKARASPSPTLLVHVDFFC
jgi:hypothetical protein